MIEISSVNKTYAGRHVLTDVSFQIPNGKVTGFVGPNGAGKSTLLRVVTGLTFADSGQVLVDGAALSSFEDPASALGTFLSAELIPEHLSAQSFLAYVCDMRGIGRHRIDEVLSEVGLEDARARRIRTFSLGMRQRLGIAAAIVGSPRNLILDEPINGLDPDGIQWLRSFVRTTADAGGAVLLSSHHMGELALVADQVILLDHGRVVRSGTISSFVSNDVVRTYFESPDLDSALTALARQGYTVERHDGGAIVQGVEPQDVGRVLFQDGPGASHLRRLERSLEETYFDEISVSGASQGVI